MKKYKISKGKTLLALAIILSMIFMSCSDLNGGNGNKVDNDGTTTTDNNGTTTTVTEVTKTFSEKAESLGKSLLGKFKGSDGKSSFFKILSAKIASRAAEDAAPQAGSAVLVDNGITFDLKPSMLDGKPGEPGKLTATGYSKAGDRKVIVTANVKGEGENKEYSNVKVRMAIQKDSKWMTMKAPAEVESELPADAKFGVPETLKDVESLPASMQGVWTQKMQVPAGMSEMTMDMYFKYVPAKDGQPEHLEMLIPGMPEMPGDMGEGTGGTMPGGEGTGGTMPGGEGTGGTMPGGEGTGGTMPGGEGTGGTMPGGEGTGGTMPGGEGTGEGTIPGGEENPPTPPTGRGAEGEMAAPPAGNGGEMPNMTMPVPKGAQFKWSVKMPSEITFIVTDSTLEPVFPELKDAKLTIAKVKKNGKEVDATLDANCDLAKAQKLFEAMHLEPQSKNVKPMDILWIKKIDDTTYDAVVADTMELPKAPKNATAEEKKEFEETFAIPEELKAFVKNGLSLTAYQKLRFSMKDKKLTMTPFEIFSAPEMGNMDPGSMKPGEQPKQPSQEDIEKQQKEMMKNMTIVFDFEKVKALGDDKLAKGGGMEFSPVK